MVLVIPERPITDELRTLMAAQSGVVTLRQAIAHGLSDTSVRRLVRQERWERVAPGVFRAVGATGWLTKAWAGLLAAGDDAVIGGLAAGHLAGLWPTPPERITVWTGGRQIRVVDPWDFRRGLRVGRGKPSRVAPEVAVAEACADVPRGEAISLLFSAMGSRRLPVDRLRAELERRRTQRHRGILLEALGEWDDGVESVLESRYERDVERRHGLPTALRQRSLSRGTRSDAVYEDGGVIVELDGRLGHEGAGRFRDAERDNRHTLRGFATLRFGWSDVTQQPCRVARLVGETLRSRGWGGTPHRCPRC